MLFALPSWPGLGAWPGLEERYGNWVCYLAWVPYLSWVSDMATGYVTWLIKVHDMHLGRVTRLECETWLKFMNQWLRYIHDPGMYALHRAWLCDLALVLFLPFLVAFVHSVVYGLWLVCILLYLVEVIPVMPILFSVSLNLTLIEELRFVYVYFRNICWTLVLTCRLSDFRMWNDTLINYSTYMCKE